MEKVSTILDKYIEKGPQKFKFDTEKRSQYITSIWIEVHNILVQYGSVHNYYFNIEKGPQYISSMWKKGPQYISSIRGPQYIC